MSKQKQSKLSSLSMLSDCQIYYVS